MDRWVGRLNNQARADLFLRRRGFEPPSFRLDPEGWSPVMSRYLVAFSLWYSVGGLYTKLVSMNYLVVGTRRWEYVPPGFLPCNLTRYLHPALVQSCTNVRDVGPTLGPRRVNLPGCSLQGTKHFMGSGILIVVLFLTRSKLVLHVLCVIWNFSVKSKITR